MLFSLIFALSFTDCSTGYMYRLKTGSSWEVRTGPVRANYECCGEKRKPAYAGRFKIEEQGNYTIKADVGSNNGITSNSLIIRLNISNRQIDQSQFTGTLIGNTNYTVTYSEYLLEGTYVYFYFEHGHTYYNSYTELSTSLNGGEYQVVNTNGECQTCDEGDPCIDDTRNENDMCAPYTHSHLDSRTFNGYIRKFFAISTLFSLLH